MRRAQEKREADLGAEEQVESGRRRVRLMAMLVMETA